MINSNVDVYKLATQYMALREKHTLSGDEGAKAAGIEKFADLFFTDSPIGTQQDKSLRWIREYEDHLRYLMENNGAPEEINGTTNIIQQLRLQKVERAMYEALGFNDDEDDRPASIFETLQNFDDYQQNGTNLSSGSLNSILLAQSIL